MPEPLARVVETAANAAPAKRYKSAGQMISALTEAVGLGSATVGLAAQTPDKRRLRWLWALVPVAAVSLAVAPVRNALFSHKTSAPSVVGVQEDYRKAHDLLEHYYRPRALETAIPLLEKIVAKDPHFAPAFADLSRANLLQFTQLRDAKYIEPTRQASLQALSLKPDLASAHVTLGTLYTWTGKLDLASQELDEALKLDKFNAGAYAALGNLFLLQGRNADAESMLQKAVSLAPEDWGMLVQLGSYYDENGKYTQAAEQYQRAADLAPDNPRAQNNLGFVYRLQGSFPQAEAAYKKSIALEPTAGHYRNLGHVLLEQGKYAEAKRMLERAVALRADDYRAWAFWPQFTRVPEWTAQKLRRPTAKPFRLART